MKVGVLNRGRPLTTRKFLAGVAHGALPPWYDHHAPKRVRAGETCETHACDAAPAEATIHLQLLDADGRRLISGGFPYRNPKPIAYLGRRTDPKTQTLYLITDNWILRNGDYSIRLSTKDCGRDIFSGKIFDFAGSGGSHRVTITLRRANPYSLTSIKRHTA